MKSKIFLYSVVATIVRSLSGFSTEELKNKNAPNPNDKMIRVQPTLFLSIVSIVKILLSHYILHY